MAGGYSKRGTAHVNRIERGVDEARRAMVEHERVEGAPLVASAAKRAAALAAAPAVDVAELVVGGLAMDRRALVGHILRVSGQSVTLRDREGLEWRRRHDQIIRVDQVLS